jgi:hypothetical protein
VILHYEPSVAAALAPAELASAERVILHYGGGE